MTSYTFASWDRTGAAASLRDVDDLRRTAPVRGTLSATASVKGRPAAVPVPLSLYGPGDVLAVDPKQIVRLYPRPGTPDAETTRFPLVEFDRTDFPWLFTPLAPVSGGELRPWLTLVCVPTAAGRPRRRPGKPLPVLQVSPTELPDPEFLHLWAHSQTITGHKDDTRRSLSRLIAPRRLLPHTEYAACLVPAFEAGRRAGLGEEGGDLSRAWKATDDAATLPVYHFWTFSTGEAGDFETLAARLRCRPLTKDTGRRKMDVSRPGPLIQPGPGQHTLDVESALRSPAAPDRTTWPVDAPSTAWQKALASALDLAKTVDGEEDPEVQPPLYGGFHALCARVGPALTGWPHTLNLDPRWRVAAGLGTRSVQREQEQLMASAWSQLAEAQAANRFVDLARFARLVGGSLHRRHVRTLSTDEILHLAVPLKTRAVFGTATLAHTIHGSALPTALSTTAFRRAVRPRGALCRRVSLIAPSAGPAQAQRPFAATIASLAASGKGLAVAPVAPDGTVSFGVAPQRVVSAQRLPAVLAALGSYGTAPLGWLALGKKAETRAKLLDLTTDQLSALPDIPAAAFEAVFPLRALPEIGVSERYLAQVRLTTGGALMLPSGRVTAVPLLPASSDVATGGAFTGSWSGPWSESSRPLPADHWDGTCGGTWTRGGAGGTWRGRFAGLWNARPEGGPGGFWRTVLCGTWESGEERGTWQGVANGTWDPRSTTSDGSFTGVWQSATRRGTWHGSCPGTWDWDKSGRAGIWRADCAGSWLQDASDGGAGQDAWQESDLAAILGGWQAEGSIPLSTLFGRDRLKEVAGRLPAAAVLGITPADGRAMVTAALDRMYRPADAPVVPPRATFPATDARTTVTALLDPRAAIDTVLRSRVVRPATEQPGAPVQWAPTFADAMWKPLAAQSTEWMLAGLERVEADTAALAFTNPWFVAAYMTGANHEFARELRWREYPTDQRGTYFTRFWGADPDMPALTRWDTTLQLGAHLTAPPKRLVLLLRTALLRRYPGLIVYAAPLTGPLGQERQPDDANAEHPIFRGTLDPETAFFGFPLTEEDVLVKPWGFVLAEHPTEPLFGLDDPATAETLAWGDLYRPPPETDPPTFADDWNDLNWKHLFTSSEAYEAAKHAPSALLSSVSHGGVVWGASAAGTARQCFQQPVRVVMPAKRLLREEPA
ncbi:hypothetical protein [Streptomyces purpureus]|uniref:Uncharacterized protein n=1 Tax=Streptomyces purpureus TaxID=1951 RepID=A0A918GWD1_9ACTN|nr:hypothetical protein [Streptomyces purpureus]GGT14736.1 hypothetical protein GCM10014713_04360 [Streptomyces purpureus]